MERHGDGEFVRGLDELKAHPLRAALPDSAIGDVARAAREVADPDVFPTDEPAPEWRERPYGALSEAQLDQAIAAARRDAGTEVRRAADHARYVALQRARAEVGDGPNAQDLRQSREAATEAAPKDEAARKDEAAPKDGSARTDQAASQDQDREDRLRHAIDDDVAAVGRQQEKLQRAWPGMPPIAKRPARRAGAERDVREHQTADVSAAESAERDTQLAADRARDAERRGTEAQRAHGQEVEASKRVPVQCDQSRAWRPT